MRFTGPPTIGSYTILHRARLADPIFRHMEVTADLNSSGARPIGQIEGTAPDAPFACDREMRIDKWDRIALRSRPISTIKRRRIVIMTGGASTSPRPRMDWRQLEFFSATPTSLSVKQVNSSAFSCCQWVWLEVPGSPTNPTATATEIGRTQETSNLGAKTTHLVLLPKKQNTRRCGTWWLSGRRSRLQTDTSARDKTDND